VEPELLWSLAVVLYDAAILLCLRGAELGPELDDVVCESLDVCYPTRVLLVDAGEFSIELVDVGWREIEAGWYRLVWTGRGERDLYERGFEM
jgi:hypothetical protein